MRDPPQQGARRRLLASLPALLTRSVLARLAPVISLGELAACAAPRTLSTGAGVQVPVSALRRLIAERTDPVTGRCRYVAETDRARIERPILLARAGESIDLQVINRLPQPTTIHFHGMTLPAAQDGAGFEPIAPGASARLQFVVRNRSGLYWFHPHAHGFTAEQVYAGLVGLLIVRDDDDAEVDRALAIAPSNRQACAISDVRISNGVIAPYAPTAEECASGWIGERTLVNGTLDPVLDVAPGWVRLQLLNAGN